MSKKASPLVRLWHGALLVLGIVIIAQLVLNLLAQIWGWLLAIGLVGAVVTVLVRILRIHRGRW